MVLGCEGIGWHHGGCELSASAEEAMMEAMQARGGHDK